LYTSLNIAMVIKSRMMRWAGHVACMAETRYAYKDLVRIPDGKRPLGRHKYSWKDVIRMDFMEIG